MSATYNWAYRPGVPNKYNSSLRGNGDPGYVRGGLGVNEFPINAKFIQLRYMIKVNNLKP